MPNPSPWLHSDAPAETGPDYVALVIEWDDLADDVTEVTPRMGVPDMIKARLQKVDVPSMVKKISIGAGALGALLFARWGIHRLRHA